MRDTMRRLIAVLMSLMLLLSSVPFSALAESLEIPAEAPSSDVSVPEAEEPMEPVVDISDSTQVFSAGGVAPLALVDKTTNPIRVSLKLGEEYSFVSEYGDSGVVMWEGTHTWEWENNNGVVAYVTTPGSRSRSVTVLATNTGSAVLNHWFGWDQDTVRFDVSLADFAISGSNGKLYYNVSGLDRATLTVSSKDFVPEGMVYTWSSDNDTIEFPNGNTGSSVVIQAKDGTEAGIPVTITVTATYPNNGPSTSATKQMTALLGVEKIESEVEGDTLEMFEGEARDVEVWTSPLRNLTVTSSDESVVKGGITQQQADADSHAILHLTAGQEGSAIVAVRLPSGLTRRFSVTVRQPELIVAPDTVTLAEGSFAQISTFCTAPADAVLERDYDDSIIKLESGSQYYDTITALKEGTTTITYTLKSGDTVLAGPQTVTVIVTSAAEATTYYTVNFYNMDGIRFQSQVVAEGEDVTTPALPSVYGYNAEGYSSNTDLSSADIGEGETISNIKEDMNFYAVYVPQDRKVTFVVEDGSPVPEAQSVKYGEVASQPAGPTPNDPVAYSFDGWYTEDGQKYDFWTPVTGDITLYAHWVEREYYVNFVTWQGIKKIEGRENGLYGPYKAHESVTVTAPTLTADENKFAYETQGDGNGNDVITRTAYFQYWARSDDPENQNPSFVINNITENIIYNAVYEPEIYWTNPPVGAENHTLKAYVTVDVYDKDTGEYIGHTTVLADVDPALGATEAPIGKTDYGLTTSGIGFSGKNGYPEFAKFGSVNLFGDTVTVEGIDYVVDDDLRGNYEIDVAWLCTIPSHVYGGTYDGVGKDTIGCTGGTWTPLGTITIYIRRPITEGAVLEVNYFTKEAGADNSTATQVKSETVPISTQDVANNYFIFPDTYYGHWNSADYVIDGYEWDEVDDSQKNAPWVQAQELGYYVLNIYYVPSDHPLHIEYRAATDGTLNGQPVNQGDELYPEYNRSPMRLDQPYLVASPSIDHWVLVKENDSVIAGRIPSRGASHIVWYRQPVPNLELTKSADPDTDVTLGATIVYTLTVKNTGEEDLVNVTITDTSLTPIINTTDPSVAAYDENGVWTLCDTLGVGESQTITYQYVVTSDDIANGQIYNNASAKGECPYEDKVEDEAEKTVTTKAAPGYKLAKAVENTSRDEGDARVGDILKYTITVTNTGDTPVKDLTVTDNSLNGIKDPTDTEEVKYAGAGVWTIAELKVGVPVEITYTYEVKASDGKSVYNKAIVEDPENPYDPEDPDPDHEDETETPVKRFVLTKSVTGMTGANDAARVGDTLTYTIKVENKGAVTLKNLEVTDKSLLPDIADTTKADGVTYDGNGVWTIAELKAGDTVEITYTYVVKDASANVKNAATVEDPKDPDDPDDPDPDHTGKTDTPVEKFELKKSVKGMSGADGTARIGDTLTYTIKVENKGTSLLKGLEVTDTSLLPDIKDTTKAAGVTYDGNGVWTIAELKSGDTVEITYTYVVKDTDGVITNVAIVEDPDNPDVDPNDPNNKDYHDPDHVDDTETLVPNFRVTKDVDPKVAIVGDTLTYTVVIENIGGVDLRDLYVTDFLDGENILLDSAYGVLSSVYWEVNKSIPQGYEQTVFDGDAGYINILYSKKTQEDLNILDAAAGKVTIIYTYTVPSGAKIVENTIRVKPDDPDIEEKEATATTEVASIQIVKTIRDPKNSYKVNDWIYYDLEVTNTGNFTLAPVTVYDTPQNSNILSCVFMQGTGYTVNSPATSATIASLKPGESRKLLVRGTLKRSFKGDLQNNAKAVGTVSDARYPNDAVKTVEDQDYDTFKTQVKTDTTGSSSTTTEVTPEPTAEVNQMPKSVSGRKIWDDNNDAAGKRPESIVVRLLQNGTLYQEKRVSAADNWAYVFNGLPMYDLATGAEYNYTISEQPVDSYYGRTVNTDLVNKYMPDGTTFVEDPTGYTGQQSEESLEAGLMLPGYTPDLTGSLMNTGDDTPVYPFVFGGIGAVAVVAALVLGRKKKKKEK